MGQPVPPPDFAELLGEMRSNPARFVKVIPQNNSTFSSEYLHWERLRFKTPPEDLSPREWWLRTKLARLAAARPIPLQDKDGRNFTFTLPDVVLRGLDDVNRDAGGQTEISQEVANPAARDRYLVSSLIEETINSSQLEGASTTRKVAKDMIRSGRLPRDRDELMILNNYKVMRMIGDLRKELLTPELICEIHRVVTEGTLANPDASGRSSHLPKNDSACTPNMATFCTGRRTPV